MKFFTLLHPLSGEIISHVMSHYDIIMLGYASDSLEIGEFGSHERRIKGSEEFCELLDKLLAKHEEYVGNVDPSIDFWVRSVHFRLQIQHGSIVVSDVNDIQMQNIKLDLKGFRDFISGEEELDDPLPDSGDDAKKSTSKKRMAVLLLFLLGVSIIFQVALFMMNRLDSVELDYTPIENEEVITQTLDQVCGVYRTGDFPDSEFIAISPSGDMHYYLFAGGEVNEPSSYEFMESMPYSLGTSDEGLVLLVDDWIVPITEPSQFLVWADIVFLRAGLESSIETFLMDGGSH